MRVNEIFFFSSTLNLFNHCIEESSSGSELKIDGVLGYIDCLHKVNRSIFIYNELVVQVF